MVKRLHLTSLLSSLPPNFTRTFIHYTERSMAGSHTLQGVCGSVWTFNKELKKHLHGSWSESAELQQARLFQKQVWPGPCELQQRSAWLSCFSRSGVWFWSYLELYSSGQEARRIMRVLVWGLVVTLQPQMGWQLPGISLVTEFLSKPCSTPEESHDSSCCMSSQDFSAVSGKLTVAFWAWWC